MAAYKVERKENVEEEEEFDRPVMGLSGVSSPTWFPSGKVAPPAGFAVWSPSESPVLVHKPYYSL